MKSACGRKVTTRWMSRASSRHRNVLKGLREFKSKSQELDEKFERGENGATRESGLLRLSGWSGS